MSSEENPSLFQKIDSWGTYLSVACSLHCALMPTLMVLLPFLAARPVEQARAHQSVIFFSILLSLVSFCWGFRKHKRWRLLSFVAAGVGLLAYSQFSRGAHVHAMAATGAACLALGHMTSQYFCRRCVLCEHLEKR